ncbi:MAG: radical SAM protein [Alphaproteobacteria bacterium]|nr:radical SAM protein [Alphaproteobacteria bacterium]
MPGIMKRRVPVSSAFAPLYVVWELTLKCDLACRHCGSRAGRPRAEELSLAEAVAVADQLAELGTLEVAFIGGEAYLNEDWLAIIQAVRARGMRATMTTGARALTPERCRAAAEAGLQAVSVSIDGMEATHDLLRAVKGSWKAALAALGHAREAGIAPLANTQLNRLNMPEVEALTETLMAHRVRGWQVQLTGPMGRAADRPEWLLQPYDMLALIPRLAAAARRMKAAGITVNAGNNLGYFGPYERDLRIEHWKGCAAGRHVLGIESNGDVKGCPSLPSAPYVGGNLREMSLQRIWEETAPLRFARDRAPTEELWGYCQRCYYADACGGGCSWTAHTLLGRRGNMPYCHHRAMELAREGVRERLVKVDAAPGTPFDFGRFEIITEPMPEEPSGPR